MPRLRQRRAPSTRLRSTAAMQPGPALGMPPACRPAYTPLPGDPSTMLRMVPSPRNLGEEWGGLPAGRGLADRADLVLDPDQRRVGDAPVERDAVAEARPGANLPAVALVNRDAADLPLGLDGRTLLIDRIIIAV